MYSTLTTSPVKNANLNNTNVGPTLFATLLKGDTSRKSINFYTLVTPASNGAHVVVSKEPVCVVNEWLNNTVYRFFLGKSLAYPIVENYVKNTWSKFGLVKSMMTKGRPSYIRAMFGLQADVELKDTIMGVVPKFVDECPKQPVLNLLKNLKNPRQAVRGVQNSSTTSGKKNQYGLSRQEVSNLNLFDALNSVKNDDDLGDENPIRTLGDYSKPSHKGYRNTIELPIGNNVDFLKLVDSLDLDGKNEERTRLRLFQFSLRDQASNWLERLPAGSISTWEDLTTLFLAQFFSLGRTAKLRNDILMFQQHHGESLSEAWTRFKDLLQKFPYHGIDIWL
ncbi:zinc finger, CCHC-type containing protein [Tanacetum coccineum]